MRKERITKLLHEMSDDELISVGRRLSRLGSEAVTDWRNAIKQRCPKRSKAYRTICQRGRRLQTALLLAHDEALFVRRWPAQWVQQVFVFDTCGFS